MNGRRIVFRADASAQIGSGHVMRCLALADVLRGRGAETTFVCRTLLDPLRERIAEGGHGLIELPAGRSPGDGDQGPQLSHANWLGVTQAVDAAQFAAAIAGSPCDWIVVDHYALDKRWEAAVQGQCGRLMVVDDIADRQHIADLLLDQNLGRQAQDYADLVPRGCRLLTGPSWALLRPEFAQARQANTTERDRDSVGHLLISLGGTDPGGIALRVLDALGSGALRDGCFITVVAGLSSPHLGQLQDRLASLSLDGEVLVSVRDMAALMSSCDLAIGAVGGTAWERCAVGLPTIQLVIAENQAPAARALAAAGAAWPVALARLEQDLPVALEEVQAPGRLAAARRAAAAVTDGRGAERLADVLALEAGPLVTVRPAVPGDEGLLLDWANDPVTRASAFNTATISPDNHHAWLQSRLADPGTHRLFVVLRAPDVPIGQIRFDRKGTGEWEISYALGPTHRGRGLGAAMIEAGMEALHRAVGPVPLVARVKPENLASLRTFERLGFARIPFAGDYVAFHRRPPSLVAIAPDDLPG